MLFAKAKSYLTYYLFHFTYYFPKNPAKLSKSEEVRGKKKKSRTCVQDFLEAPPGFEPGRKGFADLCLTTWLWCHMAFAPYKILTRKK